MSLQFQWKVKMTFQEHGAFEIGISGNVIEVYLFGAFNREATLHYCNDLDLKITELEPMPFYILLDIRKVEGATPESWEVAQEHNNLLSTKNLTKKVIVCTSELIDYFAHKINESTLQDKVIYFNDLNTAKNWITKDKRM